MPISQYTLRFKDDGTLATTPPGMTIVPGVDVTFVCRVDETVSGATAALNLTGARIFFELYNATANLGLYQEGAPVITITDATSGIFTVTLAANLTDYLTAGSYNWELKAVFPDGTVRRIGYTPLTVAPSLIPTLR
jgi:hypothetical protein